MKAARNSSNGFFKQVTVQVPNPSKIPCIFKDVVHIWSGRGYLNGKPLIKPYLSGVFGSIK